MARYLLNARTARPVYGVPDNVPVPADAVEVDQATFNHVVAGDSRYYKTAENMPMAVASLTVWLPGYTPGTGWSEITRAEYDALTAPVLPGA